MRTLLVLVALIALAVANQVAPVYQCINPVDPYCYNFWAVLNCNSVNVTASINLVDANGVSVTAAVGDRNFAPGWNVGVNLGICGPEYSSGPFPWTASVTYNGVVSTSSINRRNYNPNHVENCFAGPYVATETCAPSPPAPPTTAPPTTPPPTTLPLCPYACNPV